MRKGLRAERERLVEYISGFAIKSIEVRKAFLAVERELFIPENLRESAYADNALPIGFGQTISQPSTIAVMLELLEARAGMKVLEVGSGSGYVLALLSHIVGKEGKVYGTELLEGLANQSRGNLEKAKIKNVEVRHSDGSKGWKEKAPFDRILVSCACPFIPKPLFEQLNEKGRVVAPVGDTGTQSMEAIEKIRGKPFKKTFESGFFVFVPMKGEHGFHSSSL